MSLGAQSLRAIALTRYGSLVKASHAPSAAFSKIPSREDPVATLSRATSIISDETNSQPQPTLEGTRVAIKNNICTSHESRIPTTCDSNILGEAFLSPYNATVVELLQQSGSHLVDKTGMDEFGMGSHSIHTNLSEVYQEDSRGKKLSAGGSSGGSAVAVQNGICDYALGTDTGGSVRLPAAYTGVFGFKPSYGLLSRWGVIAYANSLDTVGILGKNTSIIRNVFDALSRHDPKDPTSLSELTRSTIQDRQHIGGQTLRIGFPVEYNVDELHPNVRNAWIRTLQSLENLGHSIHSISLPRTKQALAAYYVLAPSEASSNLAKYDGIRYGRRSPNVPDNDGDGYIYAKTRGEGFGREVKRRILLGSYSLSAAAIDNYFIQAQKVRRLVQRDFDSVFIASNKLHNSIQHHSGEGEKVDFIICPTCPTPPPYLEDVRMKDLDPLNAYINDVFTVPASLAGLPAISVPVHPHSGKNEDNIGIQIIGQFGHDHQVLYLASQLQR